MKLGILFLHHTIDETVLFNLKNIRRLNPEATLVTVADGTALPNGYSIDETPSLKKIQSGANERKHSSDWLVCSWLLQRKESCDKWWICEWDTFCNVSVADYYAPVIHFPFVATRVLYSNRDPGWYWFNAVQELPDRYRSYAVGASPTIYLISEPLLEKIGAALMEDHVVGGNSELRFATVANFLGHCPCGYSPPNDMITWIPHEKIEHGQKGIFHPVKNREIAERHTEC